MLTCSSWSLLITCPSCPDNKLRKELQCSTKLNKNITGRDKKTFLKARVKECFELMFNIVDVLRLYAQVCTAWTCIRRCLLSAHINRWARYAAIRRQRPPLLCYTRTTAWWWQRQRRMVAQAAALRRRERRSRRPEDHHRLTRACTACRRVVQVRLCTTPPPPPAWCMTPWLQRLPLIYKTSTPADVEYCI